MADEIPQNGVRTLVRNELLKLDQDNPRLLGHQESQRAAIHRMLEIDPDGLVGLAEHIIEHERDQSDLFRVIEDKDRQGRSTGKYIVLDGNRRLTVYKVLETSELLPSTLPRRISNRFKALAKAFSGPPEEELCVVYPNRESANQFIELAHRGKQEGAGRSNWTGLAGAFFDKDNGRAARPGLDAYSYVMNAKSQPLDPKFPVTTLERMIQNAKVQEALGLNLDPEGEISSRHSRTPTLDRLSRLVDDIVTKKQSSRSLNKKDALESYATTLKQEFGAGPLEAQSVLTPLVGLTEDPGPTTLPTGQTSQHSPSQDRPRSHIVPSHLALGAENKRLQALLRQGKKLNIKNLPDIGGIFLRVFLEWSVEEYIRKHNVEIGKPSKNDKANRRLLRVAEEMEAKGHASGDQLKGLRTAASSKNSILNMETLNGYVHNTDFIATTLDVRQAWDQLEDFLVLLHNSYSSRNC